MKGATRTIDEIGVLGTCGCHYITHECKSCRAFLAQTNHGKRTLTVELDSAEGRARLWDLLKVADVVIDGYTRGVLGRFGFSMEKVLQRNPHLIYLKATCFGHVGPLAHGKGFQQNGENEHAKLGFYILFR